MPGDPKLYLAGWDKIDDIVKPLDDDGIPYILILGIPGTNETRSAAAGGLTREDRDTLRAAFDNHFERHPPT
jgi:precorrin-4 methylase